MITETYSIDDLGSQASPDHARRYLREVSADSIELDEEALESDMREAPEAVEEADFMNSAESYLITYGDAVDDLASEIEVVELYDLSDEIVLSGSGDYFQATMEILESERPGFTASREIGEEKLERGLQALAEKICV
jgi:hypothetical protein